MWFFYALIFAVSSSLGVIIAKKIMQEMDEYVFILFSLLFNLPVIFLIIILFFQIPHVDLYFYILISISVVLNFFASILAFRAIRISEISLINPISAFNPIFTSVISLFILGEEMSIKGWVGVLFIVMGAYVLQIAKAKKGLLEPFWALSRHRGVQMSLGASFIWAITPLIQKTAIQHTTPQIPPFIPFVEMLAGVILFTPLVKKKSKNIVSGVKKNLPLFIIGGIIAAIGQTAAFVAFHLTKLGYATAIFKTSMIFTVVFGWLFFKEKGIKERLLGSFVMLCGVILLVI